MATETAQLSPEQTRALFDILTHHEAYAEIESFKYPETVTKYGYPFAETTEIPRSTGNEGFSLGWRSSATTPVGSAPGTPVRSRTPVPPEERKDADKTKTQDGEGVRPTSESPLLHSLFVNFVLPLPWLRDLPRQFWSVRIQGILARFGEAELSESYDKGALGLRKTLATGSSSLIELVGRGILGGVKKTEVNEKYDLKKAEDLEKAWEDVVQGLVWGDLIDGMWKHMVETDDLEGYSDAVKGAAEYAIFHLATLIHHIFVVSPEGQYVLKLLENVHNLVPYKMLKQTLRVGNAASMINGMIRLLLTKLSVGGLTNWVGLTTNADDGMNLLQRIISLVLSWDAAEFRKGAERVEKDKGKNGPDAESLLAIRQYINDYGRTQHEALRTASLESSTSIVAAILNGADNPPSGASALSEQQHSQYLEYYSALLSVHDRDAIANVLCKSQPDLFTQTIRELVSAYDPMIRSVHSNVDLRDHLEDAQGFLEDFIKASKPKKVGAGGAKGEMRAASVDDYVELLMKSKGLMYKWVHAVAAKCPDVWEELRLWANKSMVKFRPAESERSEPHIETRSMDARLNDLYQNLPPESQASVGKALNEHASYLSFLSQLSHSRLQQLIDTTKQANPNGSGQAGPGMYLSRWQTLLDDTPITPKTPAGPLRHGKDVKNTLTMGKAGIFGGKGEAPVVPSKDDTKEPAAPNVDVVIKELGKGFFEILQQVGVSDDR